MLKKHLCKKCYLKHCKEFMPRILDVVIDVDDLDEYFELLWKSKNNCLCYFNRHGFEIEIIQEPPVQCPFLLEHCLES